jgi:pyruvate dehydrogenase E2 component (dihydrolipoamide acetyltransferase)
MYDFKFVDIGEGLHEGQILKWFFKVGDKVKEGDNLCLVETDKVNAEIPSPVAGVITKLGAEVGQTIHVGETLVLIDESGKGVTAAAPAAEVKKEAPKAVAVGEGSSSKKVNDGPAGVVGAIVVSDELIASSNEGFENNDAPAVASSSSGKVLATPVARKMATDLGVDLTSVKGSGEQGRIMKDDILKASKSGGKVSTSTSSVVAPVSVAMPTFTGDGIKRVKISKLRKAIVNAMSVSNQVIPATTLMDEFDVSKLVALRSAQKAALEAKGVKLTYLPFIIKAVSMAMKEFPIFNASYDHDSEEIVYKAYQNIGIAVDTPDGLIVPNIKNADGKSIVSLAQEIESLAKASRERTLKMDDISNGTFTITNYGVAGIKYGTPVIKHPEVAILGVGAIVKKPVVEKDAVVIRDVIHLSLSIDHRIIDGADGGRFLAKVRELLSDPLQIFLFLS